MIVRGEVRVVRWPGAGRKPAVVVSSNRVNRVLRQSVVARITSVDRERKLPTGVELAAGEGGLPLASWVLCHELVTLPSAELGPPLGRLYATRMRTVDSALAEALHLRRFIDRL